MPGSRLKLSKKVDMAILASERPCGHRLVCAGPDNGVAAPGEDPHQARSVDLVVLQRQVHIAVVGLSRGPGKAHWPWHNAQSPFNSSV